jgi:tripartite-type tricarboxylate transporter receptor subunit TctC
VVGPTIKEGRLRALAATSLERSKFMPSLPTMVELGFPGYEVTVWFGVFAPAGTPPDVIAKLNGEMRKYLATAEAREAYEKLGHEAAPSSPEELRAQMASDAEKYGKLIREANLKLE